jgi:mannose-6-phosphate isomerase
MKIGVPMAIRGVVQHYAWGVSRDRSLVAALSDPNVSDAEPCAELWFGTHPRGAAEIVAPDYCVGSLRSLIQELPELVVGTYCSERFGAQLPFLFKVLSVATALSIQAHPDLELAAKLHAENPSQYPDSNHKPELALALTEVELLYGFRAIEEIRAVLQDTSEIAVLLADEVWQGVLTSGSVTTFETHLEDCIRTLFGLDDARVREVCAAIAERLEHKEGRSPHEDLFLRLRSGYPDGDVGLLVLFFMNYMVLDEGQALFIDARIPHAYLSGNLVECMANSDNVVRAGLTPKFKDVETLLDMLHYRAEPPNLLSPEKDDNGSLIFASSAEEFAVRRYGVGSYELMPSLGPRIFICIHAEGELISSEHQRYKLSHGFAFFLPQNLSGSAVVDLSAGTMFEAFVPGTEVGLSET